MMQSAAVLPGESAVKGLPDILGVQLQRKGFFFCLLISSSENWQASSGRLQATTVE